MSTLIKVAAVIRDTSGNTLLIEEIRKSAQGPILNIVRGTFDSSIDRTPLEAALREIQEEAGIVSASLIGALPVQFRNRPGKIRIVFPFLFETPPNPVLTPSPEDDEIILSRRWVTPLELQEILTSPKLTPHARATLLLASNGSLSSEQERYVMLEEY